MTAPQERASVAQQARLAYLESVEHGTPLTVQQLADRFGAPEQWATSRLDEVQLLHGVQHSVPTPDPADVAWLDDIKLGQGTPVTSDEALVQLADEAADKLEALAKALDDRPTLTRVDVIARLVHSLGVRSGGELAKLFLRLGEDVNAWGLLPAGTVDEAGVVSGTMTDALVWTGEHPTEYDLAITEQDNPLVVRAGILGYVLAWMGDNNDDIAMVVDQSRTSAALLRALKHAPKPDPAAAEGNGGEDSQP